MIPKVLLLESINQRHRQNTTDTVRKIDSKSLEKKRLWSKYPLLVQISVTSVTCQTKAKSKDILFDIQLGIF